jgi:hypothetical protein
MYPSSSGLICPVTSSVRGAQQPHVPGPGGRSRERPRSTRTAAPERAACTATQALSTWPSRSSLGRHPVQPVGLVRHRLTRGVLVGRPLDRRPRQLEPGRDLHDRNVLVHHEPCERERARGLKASGARDMKAGRFRCTAGGPRAPPVQISAARSLDQRARSVQHARFHLPSTSPWPGESRDRPDPSRRQQAHGDAATFHRSRREYRGLCPGRPDEDHRSAPAGSSPPRQTPRIGRRRVAHGPAHTSAGLGSVRDLPPSLDIGAFRRTFRASRRGRPEPSLAPPRCPDLENYPPFASRHARVDALRSGSAAAHARLPGTQHWTEMRRDSRASAR